MNTKKRKCWTFVGIAACAALLIATATVGAAVVTGTAGNDTLRGTAKADKLSGRGGNDKLFGGPGNDILNGGAGNDILNGGPGADRLVCGPGDDTARGDASDKIAKDCETVKGVPAPAPPPPPPPPPPTVTPVTSGPFQGQINHGNFLYFEVGGDRTVSNWRTNEIPEECEGGGTLRGGFWAVYPNPVTIDDDGDFVIDYVGQLGPEGDFGGVTFHVVINGKINGPSATGSVRSSSDFTYKGERYVCNSGALTWEASRTS
jgi:hypothetical protein